MGADTFPIDDTHPAEPTGAVGSVAEVIGGTVSPTVIATESAVGIAGGVSSDIAATLDARDGLLFASAWQLFVKRSIDVVGSLLLLLLLAPLLLVTAAAIWFTSPGPALYRQTRVGRQGAPFTMFKFRSMRLAAHDARDDILHLNDVTGPVFKIHRDPRVTGVGRVIRRLSIDELPQLFNVLLGHMSLVGPRPPLPEEYDVYSVRERERLEVSPGLTCIWQISGRSDVSFETWVEMDLEYIRTWTIGLDLKLLAKTIPAVLTGRGAY